MSEEEPKGIDGNPYWFEAKFTGLRESLDECNKQFEELKEMHLKESLKKIERLKRVLEQAANRKPNP